MIPIFYLACSCSLFVGDDGKNGLPYLAINWIEEPEYYNDSNPDIPNSFDRGKYYETQPGTYSFEYAYEDGYGWEGHYTIKKAEPGEKGTFFRNDGKDGKDNYYTLMLSYHGTEYDNRYRKSANLDTYKYKVRIGSYVIEVFKQKIYPDKPELN